jgi:hypothetical protein
MLDYLKKSNPYFDSGDLEQQHENSPYYTDTENIQIHAKNMKGLVMDNEIGGISDDCWIMMFSQDQPSINIIILIESLSNKRLSHECTS